MFGKANQFAGPSHRAQGAATPNTATAGKKSKFWVFHKLLQLRYAIKAELWTKSQKAK